MKIKDIIRQVKKTDTNKIVLSASDFANQFNWSEYDFGYAEQDRLVGYFLSLWYCTDSYVGIRVYYLDNEPIAISSQWGRKCSENFEWVSKEAYLKVREYVKSFMIENKNEENITLTDLDQDLGNTYKIEFNGQLFSHQWKIPLLNGNPVEIIELVKEKEGSIESHIAQRVKIKHAAGATEIISIRHLDFPYYLEELIEVK